MKQFSLILLSLLIYIVGTVNTTYAQSAWQECPDGEQIVRCETYDCPQGDTNSDGACTLEDQGARYADAKNNSFCTNPISGCGEVRYFAADTTSACAIRVKENSNDCNLYNAGKPNFTTPTPLPTRAPRQLALGGSTTPSPSMSPTVTPTPSPVVNKFEQDSAEILPETGPSFIQTILLVSTGFLGLYIYEKYKFTA